MKDGPHCPDDPKGEKRRGCPTQNSRHGSLLATRKDHRGRLPSWWLDKGSIQDCEIPGKGGLPHITNSPARKRRERGTGTL